MLQHLAIRTGPFREKGCRELCFAIASVTCSLILNAVLLARVRYGSGVDKHPLRVSIALLECCGALEDAVSFDVVNAEFFDDEELLIIYRNKGEGEFQVTCSVRGM